MLLEICIISNLLRCVLSLIKFVTLLYNYTAIVIKQDWEVPQSHRLCKECQIDNQLRSLEPNIRPVKANFGPMSACRTQFGTLNSTQSPLCVAECKIWACGAKMMKNTQELQNDNALLKNHSFRKRMYLKDYFIHPQSKASKSISCLMLWFIKINWEDYYLMGLDQTK